MSADGVSETGSGRKPSGRGPLRVIGLMAFWAFIGACVAALMGFGVCHAAAASASWFVSGRSFLGRSWASGLAIGGCYIWWWVLTPYIMGLCAGEFTTIGVKKGRCRNRIAGRATGLLAGGLGILLMIDLFLLFKHISFSAYLGSWHTLWYLGHVVEPGGFAWAMLLLQFGLAVSTSTSFATSSESGLHPWYWTE